MIPNDLARRLGNLAATGATTYLDFVSHSAYQQEDARIAVTKQPDNNVSVYLETNPLISEEVPLRPRELIQVKNFEALLEPIYETFRKQEAHDYLHKQTADDLVRFEELDYKKIEVTLEAITQRNVAYRVLLSTNQDYLDELPDGHELRPFYNKLAKLYYQGNLLSAKNIEDLQATMPGPIDHAQAGVYAAEQVKQTTTNKTPASHL